MLKFPQLMSTYKPGAWKTSAKRSVSPFLSQSIFLDAEGFTLIEVFVAILIMMISLGVALQMFITAAYLRSSSTKAGDASNWIQEDYEIVKAKAEAFEAESLPYSSYCGASSANNLAATFINDAVSGLGGSSVVLGPRDIAGTDFTLTRTAIYATSAAPNSLVSLNYALTPASGGNPDLEIDAEVVVYSAFKCPPS